MNVRGDPLRPPHGTNTTALICKVDKMGMINDTIEFHIQQKDKSSVDITLIIESI